MSGSRSGEGPLFGDASPSQKSYPLTPRRRPGAREVCPARALAAAATTPRRPRQCKARACLAPPAAGRADRPRRRVGRTAGRRRCASLPWLRRPPRSPTERSPPRRVERGRRGCRGGGARRRRRRAARLPCPVLRQRSLRTACRRRQWNSRALCGRWAVPEQKPQEEMPREPVCWNALIWTVLTCL